MYVLQQTGSNGSQLQTRVTTRYSYPSRLRPLSSTSKPHSKDKSAETQQATDPSTPTAPIATLTLKTYNPAAGICLKYRTNKASEVGRLISGLGRLAGGAKISDLGTTMTTTTTTTVASGGGSISMVAGPEADVKMTDAPSIAVSQEKVIATPAVPATTPVVAPVPPGRVETGTVAAAGGGGGKGGKSKKKAGKGKR
jgi:hypothetical protein